MRIPRRNQQRFLVENKYLWIIIIIIIITIIIIIIIWLFLSSRLYIVPAVNILHYGNIRVYQNICNVHVRIDGIVGCGKFG
jgi:magnesium-transporting ATPase (P-type)